jgi:hypothetical protein
MFQRTVWMSALLASSLLVGCADMDEGDPAATPAPTEVATAQPSVHGTVNGKLLHRIARGPEHVIEFYELQDGQTAVHESLLIGDKPALDAVTTPLALSDLYRAVEPGTAVPQAIIDADARSHEYVAIHAAPTTSKAAAPMSPADGGAHLGAPLAPVQAQALTCSGDLSRDGWSGTWFLNTYCVEGQNRFCNQNWGNAYHNDAGTWFKWVQMEGDFNMTGHTQGWHDWFDCGWFACGSSYRTDWDYDVLPRHVEIWTYGDAGGSGSSRGHRGASGSSQCGHLHEAALYNL